MPSTTEKIEKFLFYLFLFLIPFQIRAFLYWGGNEWNSIFLYGSDVIFLAVVVLWGLRIIGERKSDPNIRIHPNAPNRLGSPIILGFFLIIAGISLFFAGDLGVGVFRFIKLLEFALLFLYLRAILISEKHPNYPNSDLNIRVHPNYPNRIFQVLIASGVVQAVLGIAQFLKQSSLGLKFIEAGVYVPGMPGVATFIMENGEKIMRAYGSSPHPNVLAGFLLLCIFSLYAILIRRSQYPNYIRMIRIPIFFLLVFGLFLTFSRTAIGVFIIVSLVFFLVRVLLTRSQSTNEIRMIRIQTIKLFGLFIVSCLASIAILYPYLQARFFTISFEEEAIDLRFFYNKMAFAMIKEKPWLGVGIGNFVPKLLPAAGTPVAEGDLGVYHSGGYEPFLRAAKKMLNLGDVSDAEIPDWLYQPVHNFYLLIAVEMGILGLIVFIAILISQSGPKPPKPNRMIRKINPFFFLLIAFLIIGLTDHYFWTLHSGGVMFWLALGLASRN